MDIRTITLKKCYSMKGYEDLPLEEKNRIYDAIRKEIEEKKLYTYYMILRPVGIGCQPKGFIDYEDYDRRTYIPAISHEAWGEVTYDRQLTVEETKAYDMIEKGEQP